MALGIALRRVKQHDLNFVLTLDEKNLLLKIHPEGIVSDAQGRWLDKQQWYRNIAKKVKNFGNQRQELLNALSYCSKQSQLQGPENLWIVKPGGLSRGREIKLFNKYHEIYKHC